MSDTTTWVSVKLTVTVDVPDDDQREAYAESVIKAALLTAESIKLVEVKRTSTLIER